MRQAKLDYMLCCFLWAVTSAKQTKLGYSSTAVTTVNPFIKLPLSEILGFFQGCLWNTMDRLLVQSRVQDDDSLGVGSAQKLREGAWCHGEGPLFCPFFDLPFPNKRDEPLKSQAIVSCHTASLFLTSFRGFLWYSYCKWTVVALWGG